MQAVENRTVAFSLPRPIIKNATAQFSRLLQFFKGAPLRGAFFRACMRGDRVQGIYGSGWKPPVPAPAGVRYCCFSAACAAARRAIGTRYGEQET